MKGWLDDAIRYEKGNDRYVPAEWHGEAGGRRRQPRRGAQASQSAARSRSGPPGKGWEEVSPRKGNLTRESVTGDKDSYHLCDFAPPHPRRPPRRLHN